NPAGVCACLTDLVYLEGSLVFFLDLNTGGNKVFEQPTLVLERPGTLGFIAETKRVPLPVLNMEGTWEKGFAGEALLAVRSDLGKVIPTPQRNPNVGTQPAAALWRVRVEGSLGKAPAKQTWKSEARRISVAPLFGAPDPNAPTRFPR